MKGIGDGLDGKNGREVGLVLTRQVRERRMRVATLSGQTGLRSTPGLALLQYK